ncbi:MAG: hypothetical protein AAFY28_18090 [Actinomycetota bacterium]
MRRTIVLLAATLFVVAACGDDESSDDADTTAATAAVTEADGATDEPSSPPTTATEGDAASDSESGAADDSTSDDADGDSGDGGGNGGAGGVGGISTGSATLTLANGETFEFSTLCVLEPQEAAGSEILFTVSAPDGDPILDVTQFGDEGTVTGIASISVYDAASFEPLWDATSINEAFGGGVTLSLDGSTVTGSGSFYPMGDIEQEPVDGELVATC